MAKPVVQEVRDVVSEHFPAAAISDLHVWRVGRGSYACILGLVSDTSVSPEEVRRRLAIHEELVHVTVEAVRPNIQPGSGTLMETKPLRDL